MWYDMILFLKGIFLRREQITGIEAALFYGLLGSGVKDVVVT